MVFPVKEREQVIACDGNRRSWRKRRRRHLQRGAPLGAHGIVFGFGLFRVSFIFNLHLCCRLNEGGFPPFHIGAMYSGAELG